MSERFTYLDYLRQLAADHRESGTTATAEDYEETALRLAGAVTALRAIVVLLEQYANPRHAHVSRIVGIATTTANNIEANE